MSALKGVYYVCGFVPSKRKYVVGIKMELWKTSTRHTPGCLRVSNNSTNFASKIGQIIFHRWRVPDERMVIMLRKIKALFQGVGTRNASVTAIVGIQNWFDWQYFWWGAISVRYKRVFADSCSLHHLFDIFRMYIIEMLDNILTTYLTIFERNLEEEVSSSYSTI